MDRPPQEIIDYFYKLADYNPQKRILGARQLIENEETLKYKDYVLHRLIGGLASGSNCTRLGFSTALAAFLHENPNLLTVDEFLHLLDEKLPLNVSKKELAQNVIGHHMAFLSVYEVLVFTDSLNVIIDKHLAILEKAPFLRLAFADAIVMLLENVKTLAKTNKGVFPSNEMMKLLKVVEEIERNQEDSSLYGRFSKELISYLDEKDYLKIAKKSLRQEPWAYNRLVLSFNWRSSETKSEIVKLFMESNKDAHIFNAACSLAERFFRLIYRKGELKDVALKSEDEQILLKLFPFKANKTGNRPLQVVGAICRFMSKVASDDENVERCEELADEAYHLAQNPNSQKLIDFCVALLGRKQRIGRTLVNFITAKAHDLFNDEDVQNTIKAIQEPEDEEMDEDDGEFKPITEEERRQVLAKWEAEAEDDNNAEDSLSEMETEDENEQEVDPNLKASVKEALGKMSVDENDEEDVNVEMDDEEMEELDRSLGAAFKLIIQKRTPQKNGEANKSLYWLQSVLKFKGISG